MNNLGVALIVEDDANSAAAVARVVASLGYETVIAATLETAKFELEARSPALVLLDIGLPDGNGLDLTKHDNGASKPHFIVLTGDDSKEVVINSLRANVTDFLQKPVTIQDLKNSVAQLTSITDTVEQYPDLLPPLPIVNGDRPLSIVFKGSSNLVAELKLSVSNCAKTNLDSIISGEVGVDKHGIAYAVHVNSKRPGKYVCVEGSDFEFNAFNSTSSAMQSDPSSLIRSWLALAESGTLTISDLALVPLPQQQLLVRMLGSQNQLSSNIASANPQHSRLPPRIIGLINEPWEQSVENGTLLLALYLRLAQYVIKVPSLVDRKVDIVQLADCIVDRLNSEYGTNKLLAEDAIERIKSYTWPGNILELQNVMTQSFASSIQNIVVDPGLISSANPTNRDSQTVDSLVGQSFWEVERTLLFATLQHNNGDKQVTAKSLGISLKTLYNRINAYS